MYIKFSSFLLLYTFLQEKKKEAVSRFKYSSYSTLTFLFNISIKFEHSHFELLKKQKMTLKQLFRNSVHYLSIKTELEDFDSIHKEIQKGIIFKGTNLWILVFAILVASVGLNMNSTAVVIGAMLISPLMGPINGIGYSIATYNLTLFKKSIKNFGFAVSIGLVASTGYFILSPISTAHSELLSRTYPTIYDVLIALFGGLAGIVAISSKQKGNVIPGVAIATALMPPLCTAGYGLATLQFNFFYGALYLFTINTVFIAIAALVISRVMNFPITSIIDVNKKKKLNRAIYFVIALVFIPSIYFGYKLIQKEKFTENAINYVANIDSFEGNYLLKNEIDAQNSTIILTYGGKGITEAQKAIIIEKASNFNLINPKIKILQGLTFERDGNKENEVLRLRDELYQINNVLKEKQFQLDSISEQPFLGNALLTELRKFYPQIMNCTYAHTLQFNDSLAIPEKINVVLFRSNDEGITEPEKAKVTDWVKARLNATNVKVVFE